MCPRALTLATCSAMAVSTSPRAYSASCKQVGAGASVVISVWWDSHSHQPGYLGVARLWWSVCKLFIRSEAGVPAGCLMDLQQLVDLWQLYAISCVRAVLVCRRSRTGTLPDSVKAVRARQGCAGWQSFLYSASCDRC